jgi:hypothetical protein
MRSESDSESEEAENQAVSNVMQPDCDVCLYGYGYVHAWLVLRVCVCVCVRVMFVMSGAWSPVCVVLCCVLCCSGQFYKTYLEPIRLNDKAVDWQDLDLKYLIKVSAGQVEHVMWWDVMGCHVMSCHVSVMFHWCDVSVMYQWCFIGFSWYLVLLLPVLWCGLEHIWSLVHRALRERYTNLIHRSARNRTRWTGLCHCICIVGRIDTIIEYDIQQQGTAATQSDIH